MSSIWTPGGERPVGRPGEEAPAAAPAGEPSEAELRAHVGELTRQMLRTPASVVAANHAIGLYDLALLHLSQELPDLTEASFAIDAMGALVEGMAGRWGENEAPLKDALANLRMAFVEVRNQAGGARPGTGVSEG